MTQAIHTLDLLLSYTGLPTRVMGLTSTSPVHRLKGKDCACALLHYANGAMATLQATTAAYPGFPERLELNGTLGSASLEAGVLQVAFMNGQRLAVGEEQNRGGGLLFAQTGLVLPDVVDRPLQLLGNAFGPLALALVLVLVGATLKQVSVGTQIRGALKLTLVKNLVFPALVALLCVLFGLTGTPLAVMVIAASLPMGSNVFMFSQKYEVAEDLVTASMAVSTGLAVITISMVMAAVSRWLV